MISDLKLWHVLEDIDLNLSFYVGSYFCKLGQFILVTLTRIFILKELTFWKKLFHLAGRRDQNEDYNTSSFYDSLFQAVHGVMSLPLHPQLVPQAPQHSRSLIKVRATCDGCYAHQCTKAYKSKNNDNML